MSLINIDDIQEGMVLENDLLAPKGRLLLSKGTRLTERHMKICNIWGVTEVEIAGVTAEELHKRSLQEYPPDVVAAARKAVAPRFLLTDLSHPLTEEIARIAVLRTIERNASLTEKEFATATAHGDLTPRGNPPRIRNFLRREVDLVSLPDICGRIIEALQSPKSSSSFLSNIISNDQNLSLKILQLANSPLYACGPKIETLSRAITLMGVEPVINLALSLSLVTQFDGIPGEILDMASFWKHSLACGVAAKILAAQSGVKHPERYFLMGILHDVGRLMMLKAAPKWVAAAIALAAKQRIALHDAEKALWGYDHASLLESFLMAWGLPEGMRTALPFHHHPERDVQGTDSTLIHFADFLVNALGIGNSGAKSVAPLSPLVCSRIGLSRNLLSRLSRQVDYQVGEVMGVFFK
jgi:HD-like signal output (HDOD) protein